MLPHSFVYGMKDGHRNHNVYNKLTTGYFLESESHSALTVIEFQS